LQGSVATLFRWCWKISSYFVANLSKTLHINLYQNRSSIVEVMTKNFGVFICPQRRTHRLRLCSQTEIRVQDSVNSSHKLHPHKWSVHSHLYKHITQRVSTDIWQSPAKSNQEKALQKITILYYIVTNFTNHALLIISNATTT